jgi:electron transfer flavoprotein beta subunit
VACLRHTDPRPGIDPVTGAVRPDLRAATAAPAEWAALELALRVAQAWRGRVLALAAGPPAAEATLRAALAAGADVLRVDRPGGGYLAELAGDERALAMALAGALRAERPALVLCGDRSADRGTGALPAFLAHELGAAQALGLVSVEVDGDRLLAERRLPAGRRERLLVRPPAVCSVEAAGVRLRRAPLPAVLAAQRAVIPTVTAAAAPSPVRAGPPRPYRPRTHAPPDPPAGSARERLLILTAVLAHREPPALIGPARPGTAAAELLGYLSRNGYAQPPAGEAGPARPLPGPGQR